LQKEFRAFGFLGYEKYQNVTSRGFYDLFRSEIVSRSTGTKLMLVFEFDP